MENNREGNKMVKKILVVDDSALMRRVLCDIINLDARFKVVDVATDGIEALELLKKHKYDLVILDIKMPKMSGIEVLNELHKLKISVKVLMTCTDTKDYATKTLEALDLGALDFVQKPRSFLVAQNESFTKYFISAIETVITGALPVYWGSPKEQSKAIVEEKATIEKKAVVDKNASGEKFKEQIKRAGEQLRKISERVILVNEPPIQEIFGKKVVAIASSTGGPKALQEVISELPKTLNAPVVIVQHMPEGFTKSFADRLEMLSKVHVKEAEEGDVLEIGFVYLAKGGYHLSILEKQGKSVIHYSSEPPREGVRPSANYMFESLIDSSYDSIVCVVLTGMGADGKEGIIKLREKKKIIVIAQNEETCIVYGMPRSIVNAGIANEIVPIEKVAAAIIKNVGVK